MATAAELHQMMVDGGRRSYEEDGMVAPIAFLFNEEGVGCALQPTPSDERPPLMLARLISLAMPLVFDARYIGGVAEGWSRSVRAESDEEGMKLMEGIQHGDLQKMHDAGDTSIKTSVLSILLDLEQPEKSLSGRLLDPRTDAEIAAGVPLVWDEDGMGTVEGWPEGEFARILRDSFLSVRVAITSPPEDVKPLIEGMKKADRTDPGVAVEWMAEIARSGHLRSAVWFTPEDRFVIKVLTI